MAKVIKIFDPNEKPFGRLSNDYRHLMQIDGQNWSTVTNFIFGNILQSPMHRSLFRARTSKRSGKTIDIRRKEAKSTFKKFYAEEIDDTIRSAAEEGLKVKFQNPELADALVATGNSPVYYQSYNNFLGVGDHGKGKNVYGTLLRQLRHNLQISYKTKTAEQNKLERALP